MELDKATILEQIFHKVVDMVKYAETKNALLLTFETGLAYFLFVNAQKPLSFQDPVVWIGIPVFLSIFITLISFVPNLRRNKGDFGKNILFYGDIANTDKDDYLRIIDTKLETPNMYYKDLSNQIIQNSNIAKKKFCFFKISIAVLLVIPIIVIIINWIINSINLIIKKIKDSELL